MKIPVKIQMAVGENGAAALCMMLGHFGRFVPMEELREVCVISRNGSTPQQVLTAAQEYGLEGEIREIPYEALLKQPLPLLITWRKRYYVILKEVKNDTATVVDPSKGEYKLGLVKFKKLYSGKAIVLKKGPKFKPGGERESLFNLLKDKLKDLVRPMLGLAGISLICIWLDMWLSTGIRYFMDNIVADGTEVHPYLRFLSSINFELGKDFNAGAMMLMLYMLMIGNAIFSIAKERTINVTSRNMSAVSGAKMFKKMFAQPLKFFEQYSAGELMSRLDHNEKLDHSLIQSLAPRVLDAVMMVFYFIMLLTYNWQITLICLAIEIINSFVILRLQEKNAIISRTMATSGAALNTSVLNGMNMIDTIKSTGSEKAFFNMWYESQSQCNDGKYATYRLNRVISMCSSIHAYLLQGIQMFVGAWLITQGKFTLGTLAMFQKVLGNMRGSLNNCLSSINTLQTMRTNIERVNDINHRPTREEIPLEEGVDYDKLEGHIEVNHVNYRYNRGDDLAINDVSLEVKPGQMVAIVGSTGCGKSTLLKMMADLYEPESGEILYNGKHRNEIPDVVFHSSITSVDQEAVVFEDSVYANIRMWDDTIEDYEIILAARDAQIHNRIMRDREGYGAKVLENGRNFSGGELQRLELARALAHEPTMLFLDEFTSALDALTETRVIKAIRDKGTTCVIVAHRLSTIVDCDRIYVMDKGRIVQQGTHDELYHQEGLYRELIGSQ